MEIIKLTPSVRAEILNLNVTFGENNSPLLENFEKIVYPALLQEEYHRPDGQKEYSFRHIKLGKTGTHGYYLQGVHVKNTKLEIKSIINTTTGELEYVDKEIPSAPFSTFVLLLGNHRLIHIPNQKGSPSPSEFKLTFEKCINHYVKKITIGQPWDNKPMAKVTITYIANKGKLKDQFSSIKKINSIRFKVVPENPRDDFSDVIKTVANVTGELNATQTSLQINSPKDKEEVEKLVQETDDRADIVINATLDNGETKIITQDDFKFSQNIEFKEHLGFLENGAEALNQITLPGLTQGLEKIKHTLLMFLERIINEKNKRE